MGVQTPRVSSVPNYAYSLGFEAIELAEHAGLFLDPWEQLVVMDILGQDEEGLWAAFEAALIVARQNGKGSILEVLELAWLFLCGDRLIIHTAHEFKTAAEGYLRIKMLIENTPDLHKKVRAYHGSHGDEGITLKSGQRLRFLARSKGSGRGFTADKLVWDEAYELPSSSVAASLPTLSARPNPQVVYTSSAPLDHSATLKGIVQRGRHGKDELGAPLDPETWESLCYHEWSANPEGYDVDKDGEPMPLDLDDRRGWAEGNPGLGYRIREKFIIKERAAMTDIEFARERLGVIDDPQITAVIKPSMWNAILDTDSVVDDPVSFGFDTNPDGTWSTISVTGGRKDGRIHTEVIDGRRGMNWMVQRLVALIEDWEPRFLVVDAMSPASSLIPDLAEAGIEIVTSTGTGTQLIVTNTTQYGRACQSYLELIKEKTLVQTGQTQLTAATENGTKRIIGEAGMWGWARRDSGDITALVSSTLSTFGHQYTLAKPEEVEDNSVTIFRRR